MSTIPASQIVNVTPNVIGAGGTALDIIGLILTNSTRVPINTAQEFVLAADVEDFFGLGSTEADIGDIYFEGFTNDNKTPGKILYAQYPQTAVQAYLRSASLAGISLAALQALTGSLTVSVDGVARVASSINLSSANSFSAAAALIQTGLNSSPSTLASVTGAIAASTSSFTGSIANNVLTVSATASGTIVPGTIISGTGVTSNTMIRNQLSGTTGGIGTYAVSIAQTVASTTISGTYGTLTVSAVGSGTLAVGQQLSGSGVTVGTQITALGTGSGLTGTYFVTPSQTAGSTTITAAPVNVAVTYDSVLSAFVIASGIYGVASTAGFATGSLSASLLLTQATGAVISQGAAGQTPAAFMETLLAQATQDWATFMLAQDPDGGSGNTQKLAFATWCGGKNNRYAFICWDTDASPTVTVPASSSLGQLIAAAQISGTSLVWGTDYTKAAFICGCAAAIDFTELNGRITFAFKSESGLTADVTNGTIASNLLANGYNFYGAYATANAQFIWLYNGTVSGPFAWLDSYIDQIWLNANLQLALMQLLGQVKSIPYNPFGYALIDAACMDPINAALNFGAIRANVTLSDAQISEVNSAAGKKIDDVLFQRGWYLQVSDAAPSVRAARGSPPCTLWYTDGGSIQQIDLTSVELQ